MPASDQNITKNRYKVIPRVLIFIMDGPRVLLLLGGRNKNSWAGKFNGVGGHVEAGEDILTAAYRELNEETGLNSFPLSLCGTIMVNTDPDTGILLHVFYGNYDGNEITPSAEGLLEWAMLDEVKDLPVVEDLPEILAQVQNWLQSRQLFHGISNYGEDGLLTINFRQ